MFTRSYGVRVLTVCVVVVTYHPDPDVLGNLAALRAEMTSGIAGGMTGGMVVVVDNGSTEAELGPLRAIVREYGFLLVENGDNLGIATALNVGVRAGLTAGADWFLLFDQDSRVTPGFVEAMLAEFEASAFGDRLGLLVPMYRDKRSGVEIPTDRLAGGGIDAAMTSGSLIRGATLERYGLFADELFIDAVDSEYSLRLRAAGLMLDECAGAVLLHEPATPRVHTFRGRRVFITGNYSPVRYYYQQRNRIWIARRYFGKFPAYCIKLFWHSAKEGFKIVLGEAGKWEKVKAFCAGVKDGVLERMGRRGGQR